MTSSTLPVSQWYPSQSLEEKGESCEKTERKKERERERPAAAIAGEVVAGEGPEIGGLVALVVTEERPEGARPGALQAKIPAALSVNLLPLFVHDHRLRSIFSSFF